MFKRTRSSHSYSYLHCIKNLVTLKTLLLVCCFTAIFALLQSVDRLNTDQDEYQQVEEVINTVGRDARYAELYRRTSKPSKYVKYILLWTPQDYSPFYWYGEGQQAFLDQQCEFINCYVTTNRKFFGDDVTRFNAIAFNGRSLPSAKDLPSKRSSDQLYMYVNMESADYYPVCDAMYDNFFNWTVTYRLDSDVEIPYIAVIDKNEKRVGPKLEMHWKDMNDTIIDEEFITKWRNKTKAAAWFVSHCKPRSNRQRVAQDLQTEMNAYGMKLDIYGSCGKYKCPSKVTKDCEKMLENEYYFYLSFENSFADDYVTEKVLTALQHDTIPIVFGGANYSRFLPPGSYLTATKKNSEELAAMMHRIISSSKLYQYYFKWKEHYSFYNPSDTDNVCAICAALNDQTKTFAQKVYKNFRSWWNPNYAKRCKN